MRKKHNVADPIPRKKMKDKEIQESQQKAIKEINKNEKEIEALTNEINDIELENQDLKVQIQDLRKQKENIKKQRNQVQESNKEKEQAIENLTKLNDNTEKTVKHRELEKTQVKGQSQKKQFTTSRDDLEAEYHKIIEENIKREREQKKEQAKKRQMLAMIADKNSGFKGANANELEKQIKSMESEEISDHTPIIEEILNKWKGINKTKKQMIEKYTKNVAMIKEALDTAIRFAGIDKYEDLPIVYQKAEDQMASIDIHINQMENEVDDLKIQKQILIQKIDYLNVAKENGSQDKVSFKEKMNLSMQKLSDSIKKIETDISLKRNLFKKIQPFTDEYLIKLNGTYLSEYVPNKYQIDKDLIYNEISVLKFVVNAEDYYNLIQMFDEAMKEKAKGQNDNSEIDRLRNEIRIKLENFQREIIVNNNLYSSMKVETKSGLDFDEIIKRSSQRVLDNLNSSGSVSLNHTSRKKTLVPA